MTSTIYVIATVLLVVCFLIIEKSLSRESKARIVKLEKEINLRDQMIIARDLTIKGLKSEIKNHVDLNVLLSNSNVNLKSKLHRNRNAKGIFVKSEK